ncbi:XdhC Xanthine and CO dehydrogenases maturation factor, XdhC/CoxF family [Rhabdaerophilaceae bacterium]
MKLTLLSALNAAIAAREPVALVTDLVSGEVRLVRPEMVEQDQLAEALHEAFRSGKSGKARESAFITLHLPPVRVVVTGAVHISQAFGEMARIAGLDCTIVDPRTAFATDARFPGARVLAQWPDEALPSLAIDRYTAFVALTHDPKIDDPGLVAALRANCFYIGALGSKKTHARRVERLLAAGLASDAVARVKAPVGLDIGAVSPAEIAVSILGEIIAAMRARRRG